MQHLARAVMWIEKEVLGLSNDFLLETPDSFLGMIIFKDVLEGGNFGKHSLKNKNVGRVRIFKRMATLRRILRLMPYFPMETIIRFFVRVFGVIRYDFKRIRNGKKNLSLSGSHE